MKRLLLWLLAPVLPADWSADIVRDLEEAHRRRRAARGRVRADLWLSGQAVLFAARFGLERVREAIGRREAGATVGALLQDIRLTFRSMRASPLFFGAIVGTLAVGIGANTAIFSVVRTVLLEPLPYPESERLLVIGPYPWTPAEIVLELEPSGGALDRIVGFYPRSFTVTGGDRAVEMEGAVVTPGFFRLLGARMALGRDFSAADARPGAGTAILSHGAWQRRYGGSPDAVGGTIRLDGAAHRIVGVVAPGFRQLTPRTGVPEVWTAAGMDRLGAAVLPAGSMPWAIPIARLAEGSTLERAQAELAAATSRWREGRPADADGRRRELRWTGLRSDLTGGVRRSLLILQAAVAVVLLLACVNVANLLLVRYGSRRAELAIRMALGASRRRLFSQLLTESVVVSVLGGVAGLALVAVSLELVLAVAPRDLPRIGGISVDGTVFVAALAVSLAVGALFGVVPGLAATRELPHRALKEGGRTTAGSKVKHRLSQALVVTEVALTVVLVVGAGLLVRSFASLATREPGFRTANVLAVPMSAPEHRYGSVPLLEAYQRRLLDRLGAVPGVESVALSNNLPISRANATRLYVVEAETAPREAQYGVVSPGYFRTLDIPLLRGRPLAGTDRRDAERVAVIDASMWRKTWPGQDPIGRRFRFVDDDEWLTVVGVSADIRGGGLAAAPGKGFHIPYRQRPETPVELAVGKDMVLLVRARSGATDLAEPLRAAVWEVDPAQPVPRIVPLGTILSDSTSPQRFRALLLGTFALIALMLAVAGIYGVVGQLLVERTHEFGIRKALGATDAEVVRLVLAWGFRLTAVGVALGLAGAAWAGRLLAGLLHGVGSGDPATMLSAVATVLVVALAACLLPAWRATRIEGVRALTGR